MRLRIFAIVCLLVLASAPAIAQTPTGPDTPSKEDVLRFLDLLQIKARMVQLMDGMKGGMKAGADAGLKQQLPNATPEQLAKVDAFADTVFKDLPIDERVDAVIPIYQRHLYENRLGFCDCLLLLARGTEASERTAGKTAEAMKAGQDIMLKKISDLTQRLNAEVAQRAKEARRNPPASADK